jgi:hypothetical protein
VAVHEQKSFRAAINVLNVKEDVAQPMTSGPHHVALSAMGKMREIPASRILAIDRGAVRFFKHLVKRERKALRKAVITEKSAIRS